MLSRVFPWNWTWSRSSERKRWIPFRRDSQVAPGDVPANSQEPLASRRKSRVSRHDALQLVYDLTKQGLSLADAQREVDEQFNVGDAFFTSPGSHARRLANIGGYPLEVVCQRELGIERREEYVSNLQKEAALARALVSDASLRTAAVSDEMEIGVDEGIPGSDRSVLSVRTSDGHVHTIDTFGITREGDDFVIRAENGNILGRGSSEEDAMEILRRMLVQWPSNEQSEDEELWPALEDEELLEELEESPENASRFDIIDIE